MLVAYGLNVLDIDDFAQGAGFDDVLYGTIIRRISQNYTIVGYIILQLMSGRQTVSDAKHFGFGDLCYIVDHPDAVCDRRSHWLFAEDMVPLFRKVFHSLGMQMVLCLYLAMAALKRRRYQRLLTRTAMTMASATLPLAKRSFQLES